MPQPRMATTFAKEGIFKTPADVPQKAIILGIFRDNNRVYLNLNGFTISADLTIDAPIAIGDTVWVQKTTLGYIVQGTA